jgi:hypothetical protein
VAVGGGDVSGDSDVAAASDGDAELDATVGVDMGVQPAAMKSARRPIALRPMFMRMSPLPMRSKVASPSRV